MSYDYPTAFSLWGPEEHAALDRVLTSGKFTMGEVVAAFESEFAAFHKMKHAVMVNSGSSANLIAIATLFNKQDNPLKRGDKVIVPALAWSTTYSPLVQHGLELILADCDGTWNANDPHSCVGGLGGFPRLIVGCSILGNPGHLRWWQEAARATGAYFIEDNCESLGAQAVANLPVDKHQRVSARGRDNFKLCGTFGLMNTFSLFWSHQLSAIEGGVVLTDDDECAKLCRMLRAHGWSRDVEPPQTFDQEYDFRLFGYNVRPLELHAAIAREQLKKLDGFRRQREQGLNNFATWAYGLPITLQRKNGIQSPFGIAFTVESREVRQKLVTALRANGIDCRLPTGGSFTKHIYGKHWADQATPNADKIHETGMFLGLAPYDINDKIERAVDVMRGILRG